MDQPRAAKDTTLVRYVVPAQSRCPTRAPARSRHLPIKRSLPVDVASGYGVMITGSEHRRDGSDGSDSGRGGRRAKRSLACIREWPVIPEAAGEYTSY